MQPGDIITIAGTETGVLVTHGEITSRVMVYYPKGGRWSGPKDAVTSTLEMAPEDCPIAQRAKANVRKHYGVIPYGGIGLQHARVWPVGYKP